MDYRITPVATVLSPYTQKFGIPRQPQLADAARICLVLAEGFTPDSVRGLEGFDYIWVQFVFHAAIDEGWAQLVRPPRLGGNRKIGVFACRSPHRPNHLGLSLLKLDKIENKGKTVCLWCSGADLLDGTPIVDIKPYLPFIESKPDAASGFADTPPEPLRVQWLPESGADRLPENIRLLIEQSIAQDPRPAYQDIPDRIYGVQMAGYEIRFRIVEGVAGIVRVLPCVGDMF